MTTTFGKRLELALEQRGKSRADLARMLRSPKTGELGISPSAVAQLINGKSHSANGENTVRAARFLGVSAYWLGTGEGPMTENKAQPLVVVAAEPVATYFDRGMLLEQFGMLLATIPEPLRNTFADVLAGWARSGGREDRRDVLLSLLQSPAAKRSNANGT